MMVRRKNIVLQQVCICCLDCKIINYYSFVAGLTDDQLGSLVRGCLRWLSSWTLQSDGCDAVCSVWWTLFYNCQFDRLKPLFGSNADPNASLLSLLVSHHHAGWDVQSLQDNILQVLKNWIKLFDEPRQVELFKDACRTVWQQSLPLGAFKIQISVLSTLSGWYLSDWRKSEDAKAFCQETQKLASGLVAEKNKAWLKIVDCDETGIDSQSNDGEESSKRASEEPRIVPLVVPRPTEQCDFLRAPSGGAAELLLFVQHVSKSVSLEKDLRYVDLSAVVCEKVDDLKSVLKETQMLLSQQNVRCVRVLMLPSVGYVDL